MNKRLSIMIWITACLVSLLALFFYLYQKSASNDFACQGEVTSKGNNTVVKHLVSVTMKNDRGRFDIIELFIPSDNQTQRKIISSLFFHFSKKDNRVMMVSETENQFADYIRTETNVPDFFLRQDRGLALKMFPINENAYLFVDGETPVFYCKKKPATK